MVSRVQHSDYIVTSGHIQAHALRRSLSLPPRSNIVLCSRFFPRYCSPDIGVSFLPCFPPSTMSSLHTLFLRCKRCVQSLGHPMRRKAPRRSSIDAVPILPSGTRHLSAAQLTLQRIHDQTSGSIAKKDDSRGDIITGIPAKGKPRLLLMGQRRSGKSSISSVVFHKLPPNETLFLESTARIQKDSMASFMEFQVWDFPGQIDVFETPNFDMEAIFGEIGALIWVIDAQDDYLEAVARLNTTILALQGNYPNINIEVFIHKVDGLSDDYKLDIQRDITIRIQDELSDHGFENAPVTFHLTSIYNHSIFEAFSKVIQKLIPRLGTLEAMLTNLCRTCRFEKAYLFDVMSKIYIATDSSTADMASYEICSDYIDVIIDITEVYGTWQRSDESRKKLEGEPLNMKLEDQVGCATAESCLVLHDSNKPIMLREVDRYLALVAIMTDDSYEKMPLVNMNVETVVEGITEFFKITKAKPQGQQQ